MGLMIFQCSLLKEECWIIAEVLFCCSFSYTIVFVWWCYNVYLSTKRGMMNIELGCGYTIQWFAWLPRQFMPNCSFSSTFGSLFLSVGHWNENKMCLRWADGNIEWSELWSVWLREAQYSWWSEGNKPQTISTAC